MLRRPGLPAKGQKSSFWATANATTGRTTLRRGTSRVTGLKRRETRRRHPAGEVLGDRPGDADRDVGLVSVIGTDLNSEAEAGEIGGVLVAIAERATDEVDDQGVQPERESGGGFDGVPVVIVGAGQEVGAGQATS